MTPVEFQFNYPDGKPIAGMEFVVKLPKSGFIHVVDGIIMPADLKFVTDAMGYALVELAPSSSVYSVRMTTPDQADVYDSCRKGVTYKFYVPDSAAPVRAQDLFLAPPPNSEPWDETAIQMLTDAKIAAINAAAEASVSANTALDAAERAEAAAGGIDEDADRAEAARVAAEIAAGLASTSAEQAVTSAAEASADALQTAADSAQTAQDVVTVVAARDSVLANTEIAVTAATSAEGSALDASFSKDNAAASSLAAAAAASAAKTSEDAAVAARVITEAQAATATAAATSATASKDSAAQSAADALVSKNSATASASTATLKAGEAVTSASAALASQNAAKTSETNAKASEVAAAPAIAAGLRFCGVSATAPTTRTNGTPLQQADEYHNSVDKLRYSWTGISWIALNSSSQELEVRLASDGAKMLGYNRSFMSASISTAAQMFDADAVNVREKRFTDLITNKPDPADYKTWDWQPAVQAAVQYVYDLAFSALRVGAIPSIKVPGNLYKMGAKVTTYPWVHIQSVGNVTFDFSGAAANSDGFVIHNELTWTNTGTGYSVSGSGSPCLNGSNGTILIQGLGQDLTTGRGLVVGNKVGGRDPCRDGRLCNVYVRGWQVALDFQIYSTYLWTFHDCRLENNRYNLRTPISNTNSGERMEFYNCNLSGCGATGSSIQHRGGSYDLHFVGCSFDFIQDVVKIEGGNYSTLNFTDCHFEGWDGFLVNVLTGGGYFTVNIFQSTGYPSHYRDMRPGLNSASRPLFYAAAGSSLQATINTSRISLSHPCFNDTPFVSAGPGDIRVKVVNPMRYAYNYAGTAQDQGMKDWNFQTDAVGTQANALSAWTFDGTSAVTVADSKIVMDGERKVLQVAGTTDTSYFQLTSKDKTPVRPGDLVFSWAAISRAGVTGGTTNLQCRVIWYDAAGAILLTPPLWDTVSMKTVFDSDQLPNFAEGNARYIAGEPQPYYAPPGAAFVGFRGLFTSFIGNLFVSKASVWVSK